MILKESKQSTIEKCVNLTKEQKEKLLTFFNGRGQSLWSKIDWNKYKELTWDDFTEVLNTVTKSSKKRTGSLVEGEDYFKLGETKEYDVYFINSYRASVAMASNQWGQKVWTEIPSWYTDDPSQDYEPCGDNPHLWGGAKWCISMRHTKRYWDDYHGDRYDRGYDFVFLLHKSKPYKYAVTLRDTMVYSIWDEKDEQLEDSAFDYFKGIIYKFIDRLSEVYDKVYSISVLDELSKEIAKEFGEDAVKAHNILFRRLPNDYEDFKRRYKGWYQSNETFMRSFIIAQFGSVNKMLRFCPSSYMMVKAQKFQDLISDNGDDLFGWDKEEKEAFLDKVLEISDANPRMDIPVSVAYVIIKEFDGKYIEAFPQSVLWDMLRYDDLITYFNIASYDHHYFQKGEEGDLDGLVELEDDGDFFEL